MLLSFQIADLKSLAAHAAAATDWRMPYGQEADKRPGLLLVKDEGAYAMSNGVPHQLDPARPDRSAVVYAKGCRPEDEWIGGDDWVEFFPLTDLQRFLDKCDTIEFVVHTNDIEVIGRRNPKPRPRARGPKAK